MIVQKSPVAVSSVSDFESPAQDKAIHIPPLATTTNKMTAVILYDIPISGFYPYSCPLHSAFKEFLGCC
jgi:hypothetical protein